MKLPAKHERIAHSLGIINHSLFDSFLSGTPKKPGSSHQAKHRSRSHSAARAAVSQASRVNCLEGGKPKRAVKLAFSIKFGVTGIQQRQESSGTRPAVIVTW